MQPNAGSVNSIPQQQAAGPEKPNRKMMMAILAIIVVVIVVVAVMLLVLMQGPPAGITVQSVDDSMVTYTQWIASLNGTVPVTVSLYNSASTDQTGTVHVTVVTANPLASSIKASADATKQVTVGATATLTVTIYVTIGITQGSYMILGNTETTVHM